MSEDKPASALDATVSAPGSGGSKRSEPTGPSAADAELAPGATLGRYILVEALGAGGMGMVFRARDPDLGREVAIKVLRAGDGSGGGLERRLLREAQAMATVSHDNLANVFDIGTTDGRVFIAMELVDGGTLRKLFADKTKPWRDKLAAVVSAGRGLAAAHSAGVIHRDFKPDNVLIAKNGRVKVVDFGLARADRVAPSPDAVATSDGRRGESGGLPADLSAQLTQTGALLGTPAYMAPEQHAGDPVDARSDQFGFAVTAWEAIYGERPFVSDAYSSLVSAVRSHAITTPPRGVGAPASLEAVLRRALSPAPSDRFTSMDALLEAIERATKPGGRRGWVIAAGATAVLLAGGIATYVIVSDPPASTKPTKPPKNKLATATDPDFRVKVNPFDLSNLSEFDRGREDKGEAAIARLQISQALDAHGSDLATCFADAGIDRQGRVSIQFTIRPDGRVESFATTEDSFPDTGVASCIGSMAMKWTFPPSKTGEARVVTFPFQYTTDTGGDESRSWGDFPFNAGLVDLELQNLPGLTGYAMQLQVEIDEVDDHHYALPKHLATQIANDPELASHARIVPFVLKGKQQGYRLSAIREDSPFELLGLAEGDVVLSINGTKLASEAAAKRAVEAAKTASRVELEIQREGERLAISIDVMPDAEIRAIPVPPTPPGRSTSPPTPPTPPTAPVP